MSKQQQIDERLAKRAALKQRLRQRIPCNPPRLPYWQQKPTATDALEDE